MPCACDSTGTARSGGRGSPPRREPVPAERIDVAALSPADRRASIALHAERLQRSLDLHAGPILRMAWFDAGATQAGRLLIVVHHLATDGVSWRIVLEDLQAAYADAVAGRVTELPAPATSLRQWAQRLAEHARVRIAAQRTIVLARAAAVPGAAG